MRILLLAGGGGTRLWPLSTDARPKQFLPLVSERSLLRETYDRLLPLTEDVHVATGARYVDMVRQELPREFPRDRLFAETARRNSGPAVLWAALQFASEGDPVTAAIPSDQTVADGDAFRRALAAAEALADKATVVLLAVPATRPETDFGYLELRQGGTGEGGEVLRFVEKPDARQAEEYVRRGHSWNAGIFVFRPSRFLAEARRVAEPLVAGVERFVERLRARDPEGAAAAYARLPAISIDYAVIERAEDVRAVPLRARWSDVGTWRSIRELRGATDERGNLVLADVPVLAPGMRDCAVVVSAEGVLVLPFDREGELRAAVERLRQESDAAPAGNGSPEATARREAGP